MPERIPIRLLLIEDSPTDALLFRENISGVIEVPFNLLHRDNLEDGLELLNGEPFDAVVLDLNLPDSAGLVTFNTIRGHKPDVPVIILTGHDDRALSNQALLQGADNYLLKDTTDGNKIAIAILSAIRNRSTGVNTFNDGA